MATTPPVCDFGWPAADFTLPGTDGRHHALSDIRGPKGMLLMFICNHCPYVIAVRDRIVRDARDLEKLGIGVAAICSNDAESHPADSFDNMVKFAADAGFPFPYLHDADQSVARAYNAACTPDFFGFNADLQLQYRGRLDASGARPAAADVRRDLYEAMREIAETGLGPPEQIASMGCSIKWKAA
ncbi:thioredoxin family protein [Primorskyibacter marinus]|uniref:thioredoxin family protein n=1 Tax=Primorskyibacter marinus TaxID=1977320 RepID=UPI000E30B36D|nr:thioredoxin family protein [Primorskyibacter marinus]